MTHLPRISSGGLRDTSEKRWEDEQLQAKWGKEHEGLQRVFRGCPSSRVLREASLFRVAYRESTHPSIAEVKMEGPVSLDSLLP